MYLRVLGWCAVLGVLMLLAGCGAKPVVTKAEFEKLTPGMSYAQAVAAIGAEGTNTTPATASNPTLPPEAQGAKVYRWTNSDKSFAQAVFSKDDKLMSTAEDGLK